MFNASESILFGPIFFCFLSPHPSICVVSNTCWPRSRWCEGLLNFGLWADWIGLQVNDYRSFLNVWDLPLTPFVVVSDTFLIVFICVMSCLKKVVSTETENYLTNHVIQQMPPSGAQFWHPRGFRIVMYVGNPLSTLNPDSMRKRSVFFSRKLRSKSGNISICILVHGWVTSARQFAQKNAHDECFLVQKCKFLWDCLLDNSRNTATTYLLFVFNFPPENSLF